MSFQFSGGTWHREAQLQKLSLRAVTLSQGDMGAGHSGILTPKILQAASPAGLFSLASFWGSPSYLPAHSLLPKNNHYICFLFFSDNKNSMGSSCGFGEGNGTPLQYSCLENPMDGGAWWATVYGVTQSQTRLSNFTFTFHFNALEKEMATHSSVLAWRIPGMGEPDGLPSMGSHRVGHD